MSIDMLKVELEKLTPAELVEVFDWLAERVPHDDDVSESQRAAVRDRLTEHQSNPRTIDSGKAIDAIRARIGR